MLTTESGVASGDDGYRVTTLFSVLYMSEMFHDWRERKKKKPLSFKFQSEIKWEKKYYSHLTYSFMRICS